jgi:hypothetical protein
MILKPANIYLLTLPLLLVSVGWSVPTCAIYGRVTDPTGASVRNASVVIYTWDSKAAGRFTLRNVATLLTDDFGEFHDSLPAGRYEIFCASPGFLPVAVRISLVSSAVTRVPLQLQRDPSLPFEACCEAVHP